jgi:hypothetical protein
MVILTPIEGENFQVFKGKARGHSCPDLPLRDSSNKYGRQPWYADTRVERDGLSHRCLPYYQRWTHWASVKYVKKKKTGGVSLSIGVRINMIHCVVYLLQIFKMFHGLMNNPVYCLMSGFCIWKALMEDSKPSESAGRGLRGVNELYVHGRYQVQSAPVWFCLL